MQHYKNKKVAIVGLSVEGLDSLRFFTQEGAHVTPLDRQMGPEYLVGMESFDLVVRTPGMLLSTPTLAKAKHLTSLTKLFFEECKAPIIGVTGTKGKGTTATLIYEMLKEEGKQVWLGGNVGTPLLSRVREIKHTDIVVLELSSFQLEDLTRSPHIAVVLKITEDHLANFDPSATNFHSSRAAYIEAKKSIVRYQHSKDIVIYNRDDLTSTSFAKESNAKKYTFSKTTQATDAYVINHRVFFKKEEICSLNEIHLIGDHNLENIAAASLASSVMGASVESIRRVAHAFKGLPHRLERVRVHNGITYYNDSFSTVPETTIAAIQSFTDPIILIVGGSEKGSDYKELGKIIVDSQVKTIIVIGKMTQRILQALVGFSGKIVTGLTTMHEIVHAAHESAQPGEVVLLSPACASFDMFHNYKERGKLFTYEVSLL